MYNYITTCIITALVEMAHYRQSSFSCRASSSSFRQCLQKLGSAEMFFTFATTFHETLEGKQRGGKLSALEPFVASAHRRTSRTTTTDAILSSVQKKELFQKRIEKHCVRSKTGRKFKHISGRTAGWQLCTHSVPC